MEKLKTALTFLNKYKTIILAIVVVVITAIIAFSLGKGSKVNTEYQTKVDAITSKQELILNKLDSTNKSIYQIQVEQRYIKSNIDRTLKNISKTENERIKQINAINTNPIDGTLVFLSNRYNKLSKDTISK